MIEKQIFQPTVEMSDDHVQIFVDFKGAIRRSVLGATAAALILTGCAGPGGTKSRNGTSEVRTLGGEIIQTYLAQVEVPNDIAVGTMGAKRQMPGGPAYDAILPTPVTSDGSTKTSVNQAIGVLGIAAPTWASVHKTDQGVRIARIDAQGRVDAAAARRPDQVNVQNGNAIDLNNGNAISVEQQQQQQQQQQQWMSQCQAMGHTRQQCADEATMYGDDNRMMGGGMD